ncbi:hypothetical protein TWF481_001485 [Arthrobotrys musiformis]|uniref:Nucleoside phosphorylase domain-containing protein n=1 Tax=Arthrobotrys musiformis TaxID=47236 RepID=A0AAV9WQP7_9PEZI
MGIKAKTDYTVGWICALERERDASVLVLDEVHSYDGHPQARTPGESRDPQHPARPYVLGRVGRHNVVIATLPVGRMGNVAAATTTTYLVNDFPSIRFALMVGIAGAIPNKLWGGDVRVGDVVVGFPDQEYVAGIAQWFYRYTPGPWAPMEEYDKKSEHHRPLGLNPVPKNLENAILGLQKQHTKAGSQIPDFIAQAQRKHISNRGDPNTYRRPQADNLYKATYSHQDPNSMTCDPCDPRMRVDRPLRGSNDPYVHHKIIASADILVKDPVTRIYIERDTRAKCIEMESLGTSTAFGCLTIRGLCDYADSHKNKIWQDYASLAAAAYAKELLEFVSVQEAKATGSPPLGGPKGRVSHVNYDPAQGSSQGSGRHPASDSSRYTGGGTSQYPGGGSSQYPGGGSSSRPSGSESGRYPGGGTSQYPAGGTSQYPAGGTSQYPAGGTSQYSAGGTSQYYGGGTSQYPGGGSSSRPSGSESSRPSGNASSRLSGKETDRKWKLFK